MIFAENETEHVHEKNPLYALRDELQAAGRDVVDLISGNVNEHGIVYPQDKLLKVLVGATAAARVYHPDPLGQRPAREAISRYYAPLDIPPEHVLLTPGTSVSYWYCFKLLAQPGDEILCPRPSYPLFDYIAKMCGVRMVNYQLRESAAWAIDLEDVERNVSAQTRAIVLISPHNPTGMVAGDAELQGLAAIARSHNLPIISDEVFSPFLFGLDALPRPAATSAPLVFTLNGFSKMFALPGMKIGWIAASGEPRRVHRALAELELISDTFLPVNEIAQAATPGIFEHGQQFLAGYRDWVAACRQIVLDELAGLRFVPPRGGFYVTLPVDGDEDETAMQALREQLVLVHPGWFYDIEPNHLVMTFVQEHERLRAALRRLRSLL